jgi:hypothetical protein
MDQPLRRRKRPTEAERRIRRLIETLTSASDEMQECRAEGVFGQLSEDEQLDLCEELASIADAIEQTLAGKPFDVTPTMVLCGPEGELAKCESQAAKLRSEGFEPLDLDGHKMGWWDSNPVSGRRGPESE